MTDDGRERRSDGAAGSQRSTRGARAVEGSLRRIAAWVPPRPGAVAAPVLWFRLGAADRTLVAVGDEVSAGQPLFERGREVSSTEIRLRRDAPRDAPGATYDPGTDPKGRGARPLSGTILFHGTDGRTRIAVAKYRDAFPSPVAGTIEAVEPGAIALRAAGFGIPGAVAWGQPVGGPLRVAVADPDAELRASAIDVAAAGTILVAGARVDIEALTRARAIGVRGIISGGLVGKELRQLEASDVRQRAGLHAAAPFGLVMLDGYGRRAIPGPWWDALRAASGRHVGLCVDPAMVVLDEALGVERPRGTVRVGSGDAAGLEGPLLGAAGPVRQRGGLYQASAIVALDAPARRDPASGLEIQASEGAGGVRSIPTADLERFE